MDVAEVYLSSGLVSPRFCRLIVLCRRLGILLRITPPEEGECWIASNELIDGKGRRVIYTQPGQIFKDLECGLMSFSHEIGHHCCPLPAEKKKRFYRQFRQRKPVGLLQIPVEIFAWIAGYGVVSAAVREYFSIAAYARYAAESTKTYIDYYFMR